MKNLYLARAVVVSLLLLLGAIPSSYGQTLIADGQFHTISYTGAAQTYSLPNNSNIAKIEFELVGGSGGYARVREDSFFGELYDYKANGARGAKLDVTFPVGNSSQNIRPGSSIRFVVGGRGANGSSSGVAGVGLDYGGGGGGTAVLDSPPGSSSWSLRGVAGGGSGAYVGVAGFINVSNSAGEGGREFSNGGTGGGIGGAQGGLSGAGGNGTELAGAGGGAWSNGGGITCVEDDLGTFTAGEGGAGVFDGGYGGDSDGCLSLTWRNGGWGYGGGGAGAGSGGGGGGYSGGGAGGASARGGAGGSYFGPGNIGGNLTAGTTTGSPSNGYIRYKITLNQPPVASCRNRTLILNSSGFVRIDPRDIDNGSSDSDGFIADRSVSPSILYCSSIGRTETVTLTVTDNDGATSTCTAWVTVLDRSSPSLTVRNYTASLTGSSVTIANSAVVQFVRDNCGSYSISLSKRTFTCADVGTNFITVTATDASGNETRRTARVDVRDTRKPTANCTDMVAQLDANGLATVSPSIIGAGSFDNCGIRSRTLSKTDFDCADVGTPQTVTLTVTDVNNNVSTCTSTVTVVDNVKPTALCKDFTVQLDDSGMGTLSPSDIDNGSSDNCGIQGMAVSKTTFGCDDVGSQPVVLTITDIHGNVSSCTAMVTVEDNVAPEALCMDKTIELDINGNASISVTDIDNGSNDACGIADRSLNMLDFDCSHVGDNTVTLTVIDVNGNIDDCSATVTVEDNIAPTFAVTQSITLWPPNHDYHTIDVLNYIDVGSIYDNCGGIGLNDIYVSQVSSDEAENDDDDGNTTEDMVIAAGCQSVDLRAERSGADGANGRVYTITLALEDVNGNTGFTDLYVLIPVGKQDEAINDGSIGYVVSCGNENARLGTELPIATEVGELGIYPNPFNAHVNIDYEATHSERVDVTLFSLTGAKVGQVYEGLVEMGQSYRWRFVAPGTLADGILILRIQGQGYTVDRKLLFRR